MIFLHFHNFVKKVFTRSILSSYSMTKSRTRVRTKNNFQKRRKTRSARGGTYESFTDLKKADDERKLAEERKLLEPTYEKFSKPMLAEAQGERQELDSYYTKWKQTECSRIDDEIESHQREIARLKQEKKEIRCVKKNIFGF